MALYYPPDQVKNDKALEVPLSRATVDMLDLYLRKYRPALIDVSSSWLFPTQDGGPKLASVRSADIQKLMRQYIGSASIRIPSGMWPPSFTSPHAPDSTKSFNEFLGIRAATRRSNTTATSKPRRHSSISMPCS